MAESKRSEGAKFHYKSTRTHINQHQRKRKRTSPVPALPLTLPFNSQPLVKADYKKFKNTFALYLDIQKGKYLEDLDEIEVKGRWKSFVGKWNRAELSEGWYDPSVKQKASEYAETRSDRIDDEERADYSGRHNKTESSYGPRSPNGSISDQSIGPMLPNQELTKTSRKLGPIIPGTQDLQIIRENREEERLAYQDRIKLERKADRIEQKAALDELVPQSMPGTRERQIEKKRELNMKMKSFRERSPGTVDVPDAELMGGGEDLRSHKKAKQDIERKKNERELRKEENLRARIAEREERLREYRAKEEGTMAMLKALAKHRFG